MTLKTEGLPFFLQVGIWVCITIFLASFLVAIVAYFFTAMKVAKLNSPSEFRGYKSWERMGRRDSNFSKLFFFAPEIQRLRRLIYYAGTGVFLSFGTLLSLIFLFGDQAPH